MTQRTHESHRLDQKNKYVTDPPLENQVQSIHQLFNNLITIINDDIQSNNEDEDDFFFQNKKQSKKNNNNSNVKSIGIELKTDIHKLYVDAVKTLRYAQKNDQGDNIQYSKSYLLEQFNDLKGNLHGLRIEMINLLQDTIKVKGNKLSNSLIFDFEKLIDEIMNQFCEDLYDIYLKMIQYSDSGFSKSIFSSLFNGIYDFTEDLEKIHLELIQCIDSIVYPANTTSNFVNNSPEFSNVLEKSKEVIYKQRVKKLTEFFTEQINLYLVDFQEAVNLIHLMHKRLHDFSFQFYEQLTNADPKFNLLDLERVYKPRCDGFSDICNYYGLISSSNKKEKSPNSDDETSEKDEEFETDNNYNLDFEQLWEKVRRERCIDFACTEISFAGETLQNDLFQVWHGSVNRFDRIAIGNLLYNVFNARFEIHDSGLSLATVSAAYNFAVKIESTFYTIKRKEEEEEEEEEFDEELSANFQSLLEGMLDAASSDLLSLRRSQIRFLSNPPQGDSDSYIKKAKKISEDIQSKALDLNAALYSGRETNFINSQRLMAEDSEERRRAKQQEMNNDYDYSDDEFKNKNHEEEEEEEEFIYYTDSFEMYDNEESEEIKSQLDKIISISNNIFQTAKNSQNADFNDRPRSIRQSSKSQQNQIFTKSMKMSIQRNMSDESLVQVTCVEDAMASIYIQLFASIKGTLFALIRVSDTKRALKVKGELNERIQEFMGHLDSIKKRAKVRDDVKTIKAIDERLSYLNGLEEDSIKNCICDSLRNFIEFTFANYDRNINMFKNQYSKSVDVLRSELNSNLQKIKIEKHIPDLILIEKKKLIATKKEEQRPDMTSYESDEAVISNYIEKKNYQLAEREKAKLAKKKEEKKQKKLKDVESKYNEMKNQKLKEQQDELLRMERRFEKKMNEEKAKMNRERTVQTRILATSMKTSSLRHYKTALKIVRIDAKTKREVQRMLNKVVNDEIEKRKDIKDLMARLLSKKVDGADWMQ
ncbi:hypothetical protein M9Y10_039945 [Tritrichomonas musculus]|uniref:Uncharacterized protein n=1 Tax=Tritrichomonas musculus TaxID=1915356 RepID=A0ABR2GRX1_9EUKA